MFGLGFTEILFLGLLAFLILGPKNFPIAAKSLVSLLNELKATFQDVKTELTDVREETEKQIQQITEDVNKENLDSKKEV